MKVLIITWVLKSERYNQTHRIGQNNDEVTNYKLQYSGSNKELGEGLDKLNELKAQEGARHFADHAITWIENIKVFEGEIHARP